MAFNTTFDAIRKKNYLFFYAGTSTILIRGHIHLKVFEGDF